MGRIEGCGRPGPVSPFLKHHSSYRMENILQGRKGGSEETSFAIFQVTHGFDQGGRGDMIKYDQT